MDEKDIVLSITLVVFSVSFSWLVSERISSFPYIRRFRALWNPLRLLFRKSKYNKDERRRLKSDLIVLYSSWLIILASLALSIQLLLRYYSAYSNDSCWQLAANRVFVPFLFLIAPQFISRLITSVVFWLGKDEIIYLLRTDEAAFSGFTRDWKTSYELNKEGAESGRFFMRARCRTFTTLLYLAVVYGVIYGLTF